MEESVPSLPSPPTAPPSLAMQEALTRAAEAVEHDKTGNLTGALQGYIAAAEHLQSWLQEATDQAAVQAVRVRALQYVERAEAVQKRMAQRQHQFTTRSARQSDPLDPNVFFYRGEIRSQPDGDYVDTILKSWYGDWDKLEDHHGYIQWLFPVFDPRGHNCLATPLSKSGAATIREDEACQRRVLRAYQMMLHFYGFALADEATGRVERLADESEFRQRIGNFNKHFHNCLRISRILTSLGELGFGRYKRPFYERLRAEVDNGTLASAERSCYDFWKPLVEEEASESYKDSTLEEPGDRAEGCLLRRRVTTTRDTVCHSPRPQSNPSKCVIGQ